MERSTRSSNKNCKVQQVHEHSKNSFESKQTINGEFVLCDVMYVICQYLNIKELSCVAQVCKSWKEEASREMDNRYLALNVLHGSLNKNPSFHVSKMLSNKPYITLLFPGTGSANLELIDYSSLGPYRYDPWNKDEPVDVELEYETLKSYRKHFPNKLVVIGVFESTMNANLVPSLPVVYLKDEHCIPNRTTSLSLPLNKHLNIKESCIFESEFDMEKPRSATAKLNKMIKNLLGENTETKSTLLIFIANPDLTFDFGGTGILKTMLKNIKSKLVGKSYTLWGLVTPHKIFVSDKYNKDENVKNEKEARLVGLNLSGPNFDSWSTVISVKMSKANMNEKLNSFKERIQLKQCNLGFITAPIKTNGPRMKSYTDHRKLVTYIKTLFPEVPFLGAFCEDYDSYFGMHLASEDAKETLSSDVISIMILSYD